MTQLKSTIVRIHVVAVILAFSIAFKNAQAQAFNQYSFGPHGGALNYVIDPALEKIDGSPYHADQWQSGVVHYKNGNFTEIKQLNYDINSDQLIFFFDGKQYVVPGKEQIKKFTLGDNEFVGALDGSKYSFFKVIEKGPGILLLMRSRALIIKGEPSKGYVPATNDKFVKKETINVLKPGNSVVEVNVKRSIGVLSLMTDKQNEMQEFIKKGRLKMKTLEDLSIVVKHYNTLIESSYESSH